MTAIGRKRTVIVDTGDDAFWLYPHVRGRPSPAQATPATEDPDESEDVTQEPKAPDQPSVPAAEVTADTEGATGATSSIIRRAEIERLVDRRGKADTRAYRVKWLGRPMSDATWESEASLRADVDEGAFRALVSAMERRRRRSRQKYLWA
ncbi:chromo domain-containing protein [Neoaquamicrobium sediminum]|uniref:chromo domain-containing protein n=1 Tax=Neoaquamicrobium sediminum TaxID=1849104 RepID=UPI004035A63E